MQNIGIPGVLHVQTPSSIMAWENGSDVHLARNSICTRCAPTKFAENGRGKQSVRFPAETGETWPISPGDFACQQ